MILDTTYLLPLAQIAVDTDLLAAVAKRKTDFKIEDISVSINTSITREHATAASFA